MASSNTRSSPTLSRTHNRTPILSNTLRTRTPTTPLPDIGPLKLPLRPSMSPSTKSLPPSSPRELRTVKPAAGTPQRPRIALATAPASPRTPRKLHLSQKPPIPPSPQMPYSTRSTAARTRTLASRSRSAKELVAPQDLDSFISPRQDARDEELERLVLEELEMQTTDDQSLHKRNSNTQMRRGASDPTPLRRSPTQALSAARLISCKQQIQNLAQVLQVVAERMQTTATSSEQIGDTARVIDELSELAAVSTATLMKVWNLNTSRSRIFERQTTRPALTATSSPKGALHLANAIFVDGAQSEAQHQRPRGLSSPLWAPLGSANSVSIPGLDLAKQQNEEELAYASLHKRVLERALRARSLPIGAIPEGLEIEGLAN